MTGPIENNSLNFKQVVKSLESYGVDHNLDLSKVITRLTIDERRLLVRWSDPQKNDRIDDLAKQSLINKIQNQQLPPGSADWSIVKIFSRLFLSSDSLPTSKEFAARIVNSISKDDCMELKSLIKVVEDIYKLPTMFIQEPQVVKDFTSVLEASVKLKEKSAECKNTHEKNKYFLGPHETKEEAALLEKASTLIAQVAKDIQRKFDCNPNFDFPNGPYLLGMLEDLKKET